MKFEIEERGFTTSTCWGRAALSGLHEKGPFKTALLAQEEIDTFVKSTGFAPELFRVVATEVAGGEVVTTPSGETGMVYRSRLSEEGALQLQLRMSITDDLVWHAATDLVSVE